MTIEVGARESRFGRELGVVSTRDIRDVPADASSVVLVVLAHRGPPARAVIDLGEIPGGRGMHRGLKCPRCGTPKYKLYCSERTLGCRACTRHRSRRQLESKSHAWRRLGSEFEDVVLRGLRPGRSASSFVPERVVEAARTLTAEDRERVDVLLRRAESALKVATTPTVSVPDVMEEYGDDTILVDDDRGWP